MRVMLIQFLVVLLSATANATQTSTPPAKKANTGHSASRTVLIGAGIGAGIGVGLGAAVDHSATCVDANRRITSGHCGSHFGKVMFGIDGAAIGTLARYLLHRLHR